MRKAIALIGFAVAASAHAAIFTVTNTTDSGPGSLRDAIAQSNASPGANTVNFAVTGTIVLTSGRIQISGPVTIMGPGAANLTLDGNANGRIFTIFLTDPACPALDGPDYLVSISGLRITNGRQTTSQGAGAIFTEHSLSLDGVLLDNNVAGNAGAVYFQLQYPGQSLAIANAQFVDNVATPVVAVPTSADDGGALNIEEKCSATRTTPVSVTIGNSLFSGNSSQPVTLNGRGGAISTSSYADIAITDTRIVGNHIDVPDPPISGALYRGGAIYGTAKSLTLTRTEISDNSVFDVTASDQTRGGGIALFNNAADLQTPGTQMPVNVVNSTISGNSVSGTAGAIWVFGNIALELDNSTVSGNASAANRTGGAVITSGATSPATGSNTAPPTLTLISSIVANSAATTADVSTNVPTIPTFTIDAANSLIETICPTCSITVSGAGNLTAVDPKLGVLEFAGGPTRTIPILPGSPVIDAGSNPLALTTDQRGTGFARVIGAAADMGAFESGAIASPVFGSAASRKVHGGAGTFDLPLSLVTTNPTTEPRQGPAQTVVFTFDKPISDATAAVIEGTATASAASINGNDVIVGLTSVNDRQYVTVTLTNVASTDGGTGGIASVRIGFLRGDVNQNRVVTIADLGLVNAQLARVVTASNYLKDVNASGTLSLADKALTNANLTRALPAP